MKKPILLLAVLAVFASSCQQRDQRQVRSYDRSGNDKYEAKQYQDAEMDYRRALDISPSDSVARFNLATTLIRQQDQAKLAEADSILNALIMESERKDSRPMTARSLYQKGEIAMLAQQYQQAAEAYKESLKRNPSDDEARFNYLLAMKQLKNQQDKDKQNQDKQDQQQQDQQKKEEEQKKQQEQQQQDQKQNQDQQQQPQQQQNQQQQMSQDQQQSILEQNEREEKETQAKVMRRQLDKDKDKQREMEIKRMNGTLKDW